MDDSQERITKAELLCELVENGTLTFAVANQLAFRYGFRLSTRIMEIRIDSYGQIVNA